MPIMIENIDPKTSETTWSIIYDYLHEYKQRLAPNFFQLLIAQRKDDVNDFRERLEAFFKGDFKKITVNDKTMSTRLDRIFIASGNLLERTHDNVISFASRFNLPNIMQHLLDNQEELGLTPSSFVDAACYDTRQRKFCIPENIRLLLTANPMVVAALTQEFSPEDLEQMLSSTAENNSATSGPAF